MARSTMWEWDKQGDLDAHASWHRTLPTGVTITDVEAELHRWNETNEEWDDASADVTIAAYVVTALRRVGDTLEEITGGEERGVRVVITADPDAQPDGDDDPRPADRYQVKIIVTRSDTDRPAARAVPLRVVV